MITNIGKQMLGSALAEPIEITRPGGGEYINHQWVSHDPEITNTRGIVSQLTPQKLQFITGGGSTLLEDYREIHTSFPLRPTSTTAGVTCDIVSINTMYGKQSYKIISVVDRQQQGFSVAIGVLIDG